MHSTRSLGHFPIPRTLGLLSSLLVVTACGSPKPQSQLSKEILVATTLPECPASAAESDWQQAVVARMATTRVPQDAHTVTAPAGHWVWKLGDYGGFGYS